MTKLINKRYYISIIEPRHFEEITGKPVAVVDWLKTFIYRDEKVKLWVITELRTGRKIAVSMTTQKKAVEEAKKGLDFMGKEKTLKIIEEMIIKYGEAPQII